MKLSKKQLGVYFSLVVGGGVFGGSAVLLASPYLLTQRRTFQELKNVSMPNAHTPRLLSKKNPLL